MDIRGVPSIGIQPISPVYPISQDLPQKKDQYSRHYSQNSTTKSDPSRPSEEGLGEVLNLLA